MDLMFPFIPQEWIGRINFLTFLPPFVFHNVYTACMYTEKLTMDMKNSPINGNHNILGYSRELVCVSQFGR